MPIVLPNGCLCNFLPGAEGTAFIVNSECPHHGGDKIKAVEENGQPITWYKFINRDYGLPDMTAIAASMASMKPKRNNDYHVAQKHYHDSSFINDSVKTPSRLRAEARWAWKQERQQQHGNGSQHRKGHTAG